jgi:long-subunit acyl-CoA synthetase (AMP-forming)
MTPTQNKVRAKVVDNPSLEKDMSTNGVINNNRSDYIKRVAVKSTFKKKDSELQSLRDEVEQLKKLVSQLIQDK